ncbi:uncharacterized protein LOC131876655 [Cryptomeria japonica]|uniref:uncharacterized protein LOC131876655 n=1 Tax=Cryptomeria japonica TaxID=3369 RepID=UPI0027DAAC3C|nr:uncharacterized protein LOC131876655 [Cryptomeria japonica]
MKTPLEKAKKGGLIALWWSGGQWVASGWQSGGRVAARWWSGGWLEKRAGRATRAVGERSGGQGGGCMAGSGLGSGGRREPEAWGAEGRRLGAGWWRPQVTWGVEGRRLGARRWRPQATRGAEGRRRQRWQQGRQRETGRGPTRAWFPEPEPAVPGGVGLTGPQGHTASDCQNKGIRLKLFKTGLEKDTAGLLGKGIS